MVNRSILVVLACAASFAAGILFGIRKQESSSDQKIDSVESEVEVEQQRNQTARRFLKSVSPLENASVTKQPCDLQVLLAERDSQLLQELERRQIAGEYLLRLDNPMARRSLEESKAKWMHDASNSVHSFYSEVFSKLNLPNAKAAQLEQHILAIHRGSMQAEQEIQDLLAARNDFKNRLQSELGEDGVKQFIEFDGQRAVKRELELLKTFADRKSATSEWLEDSRIRESVAAAEAFTDSYWHGPFDGLPEVVVGAENVIKQLTQKRSALESSTSQLLREMEVREVPTESQALVKEYYSSRLGEIDSLLNRLALRGRIRGPEAPPLFEPQL